MGGFIQEKADGDGGVELERIKMAGGDRCRGGSSLQLWCSPGTNRAAEASLTQLGIPMDEWVPGPAGLGTLSA